MNTFNIELDLESKVRLYLQLYTQISLKVESGELKAGTKLPSVRTLSAELNVSKNTVTKAYEELQNDGFIVSREKSGFFINDIKGENPDFLSSSEPFIPTVDSILTLHQDDDVQDHIEIPGSEELLSELSTNDDDGKTIFAKEVIPPANNNANNNAPLDFVIPSEEDTEDLSSDLFFSTNFLHREDEDNVNIIYGSEEDESEPIKISELNIDTVLDLDSTPQETTEDISSPIEEPATKQEEQSVPLDNTNTVADDLIPVDPEVDSQTVPYTEMVFHTTTDTIQYATETEAEELSSVPETDTSSAPISLAEQYELPPLDFETDTVDPQSLEESIRTSFNEILSLPGSFMYKKSPAFGENCLKYAICHLLSTFRGIEVAPEQIIIAATDQMLLHNVLNLSSLNPMSQIYTHYTPGLGLLRKAETYSEKQDLMHNLTIGFIPGNTFNAEKTFNDLKLATVSLEEDSFGITPKSLENSDTTIIYSSRKDIPLGFRDDIIKRREAILNWAIKKPYRFIIENDAHTTQNSDISFLHSDKNEKVIYINSFTNLICKGVSGAWLVLPKHLIPEYQSRYFFRDCTISVLDQLFLTDFINSGKLNTYLSNLELL